MKVHKVELYIIDFDQVGANQIIEILENARYPNRCINPTVKRVRTKEIEWSDDHPLNNLKTQDKSYRDLFSD